jgi:hypothetical protein
MVWSSGGEEPGEVRASVLIVLSSSGSWLSSGRSLTDWSVGGESTT